MMTIAHLVGKQLLPMQGWSLPLPSWLAKTALPNPANDLHKPKEPIGIHKAIRIPSSPGQITFFPHLVYMHLSGQNKDTLWIHCNPQNEPLKKGDEKMP